MQWCHTALLYPYNDHIKYICSMVEEKRKSTEKEKCKPFNASTLIFAPKINVVQTSIFPR